MMLFFLQAWARASGAACKIKNAFIPSSFDKPRWPFCYVSFFFFLQLVQTHDSKLGFNCNARNGPAVQLAFDPCA